MTSFDRGATMNKRPKIVLTNDDGISAPGIKACWRSLHEANFADLYIIAPAGEKSGTGASITWDRPILIREVPWEGDTPAWAVDGTPADCVKMGERIILDGKPDFIASGINAGSNAGRNVLHSGTVGACVEGVLRSTPGVALSCQSSDTPNFHVAEHYIPEIVRYLLDEPMPEGSFLNINFPEAEIEDVQGFRLTKQGKGRWSENPYLHLDTEHGPSYWLGGKPEEMTEDDDCDISWLRKGFIAAVPIHVHSLTDWAELKKRHQKFHTHFTFLEKGLAKKG